MPCLMPPHCMTISILKKVHEKITVMCALTETAVSTGICEETEPA